MNKQILHEVMIELYQGSGHDFPRLEHRSVYRFLFKPTIFDVIKALLDEEQLYVQFAIMRADESAKQVVKRLQTIRRTIEKEKIDWMAGAHHGDVILKIEELNCYVQ